MARALIEPPRLRTNTDSDEERHATWLELLFDLVFVVAISELALKLKVDISWGGGLGFAMLFVPVWWAWVGTTFYNTRFDTDDLIQRLLVFGQIAMVAALAVNIQHGLEASAVGFAISYVAVRFVLLLQYLRAYRDVPVARPLIIWYSVGFAISIALWLLSILLPVPIRFILWGVAMVVDFGGPLTFARTPTAKTLPPNSSHIPERFGLFTLIVIGEGVAAVVRGMAARNLDTLSVVSGLLGLSVAFSLWWIYFDHIDGSALRAAGATGRQWLYTHLPLLAGLTATSVGVEEVARSDQAAALPDNLRWLLCGALALSLAAIALIQVTSTDPHLRQHVRRQAGYRLAAAAFALLVAALGGGLPPVGVAGLLALACAVQLALDLYGETQEEAEVADKFG